MDLISRTEPQPGTILELGPDRALVSVSTPLILGTSVALDFLLPAYPREINVIARVTSRAPDEPFDLEFVHLPLFERSVVRTWVGQDPPPRLAARSSACA